MTWDFLITKIENGFLLTYESELGEEIVEEAIVEQDRDSKGHFLDEQQTQARLAHDLCWSVIEHFCLGGSKHDKERVRVVIIDNRESEIEDV